MKNGFAQASIAENCREEKIIIAMITGTFDALIARQELKEKENELLEICVQFLPPYRENLKIDRYISTIIGALNEISLRLHTQFQDYRKRRAIRNCYETLVKELKDGNGLSAGCD